jgi:hypothetical protein
MSQSDATAKTSTTGRMQDFSFARELSEVYLLLDHVSGRSDKRLAAAGAWNNLPRRTRSTCRTRRRIGPREPASRRPVGSRAARFVCSAPSLDRPSSRGAGSDNTGRCRVSINPYHSARNSAGYTL